MEKFISKTNIKTSAMLVTVFNKDNFVINTYNVPEGFQIERYVATLYPDNKLSFDYPKDIQGSVNFRVRVFDNENTIIETNLGKYL